MTPAVSRKAKKRIVYSIRTRRLHLVQPGDTRAQGIAASHGAQPRHRCGRRPTGLLTSTSFTPGELSTSPGIVRLARVDPPPELHRPPQCQPEHVRAAERDALPVSVERRRAPCGWQQLRRVVGLLVWLPVGRSRRAPGVRRVGSLPPGIDRPSKTTQRSSAPTASSHCSGYDDVRHVASSCRSRCSRSSLPTVRRHAVGYTTGALEPGIPAVTSANYWIPRPKWSISSCTLRSSYRDRPGPLRHHSRGALIKS